jgi:hypothetical protein
MGSKGRLQTVVLDATLKVDERYDGYRADVARALTQALRAQSNSPTDAARGREVDKIVESLGHSIRSKVAS